MTIRIFDFYKWIVGDLCGHQYFSSFLMEMKDITGYGLGGCSMYLFGNDNDDIYTKAIDVGVDLVDKAYRHI
jgi:Na+/H+-translocating membrane pyrophosphatase